MAEDTQNTSTEGWDAYRKLVVETLKRLDDKGANQQDEINSLQLFVQSLQNKNTDSRFEKLEKYINEDLKNIIKDLNNSINDIKTTISNDTLRRRIFTVIGSGIWGIIILAISIWIQLKIH